LPVRGITLTGGEPLQQTQAVLELLQSLDPAKDVLLFTGFSLEEVMRSKAMRRVVARVDAALMGRYDSGAVHPYNAKQLVLRTSRVRASELGPAHHVEINVGRAAAVMTGFPRR
jgi:anaerobic ribonucleoside-triphosphate reductase activating protein